MGTFLLESLNANPVNMYIHQFRKAFTIKSSEKYVEIRHP